MRLKQISIQNEKYEVYKDGEFTNCGFGQQERKNMLTFIVSKKYINMLRNNNITSVICPGDLVPAITKLREDIGIIINDNPRRLLFRINNEIKPKKFKTIISGSAKISKYAHISEFNVIIGDNCIIDSNVIIKENVIVRNNVSIGPGCMLGAEGLMVYEIDGQKIIAEHNGFLYIDSYCKLLCNIVIEKAIFKGDMTYIGKDVLLDSGVSISHGCRINENTVITGCSKLSGYTNIGRNTYIGPGTVISNNLSIGDNCTIRIGSIVVDNLAENSDVSSNFAIDHTTNLISRFDVIKKYKKLKE